jgi:DnaK suppressor protein
MTAGKYQAIRAALEADLANVERQLAEHGFSHDGGSVTVDVDEGFADSAAATTERAEAIALADQLGSHRNDVVNALKRVEAGTYGKCERCGNEIPVERLEALPTATLCVACKQQAG